MIQNSGSHETTSVDRKSYDFWSQCPRAMKGPFLCVCAPVCVSSTVLYCETSWATPHLFIFLGKMGNWCSNLLKHVQSHMEIQHRRQKQSLCKFNKLESKYLVWPPLLFNTTYTLLGRLPCNFFHLSLGIVFQASWRTLKALLMMLAAFFGKGVPCRYAFTALAVCLESMDMFVIGC